jgi:hypothetical protein
MKFTSRWEMPEVWFYQVEKHGFQPEDRLLYAYGKPGDVNDKGVPTVGELYDSLDRAMIGWVGEKYTSARGAHGSGVGTAADWFARMIGMDTLVEVDYQAGQKALTDIVADTQRYDGPIYRRAQAMSEELDKRGLVLAAVNRGR